MHRILPIALLMACNGEEPSEDLCEVSGNICTWLGTPLYAGQDADGVNRLDALLYLPVDITFAPDGTAYYPDYNNHRVRKVAPDGTLSTVSGTGFLGDGPNTQGSTVNCFGGCNSNEFAWNHPTDVVVDPNDPNTLWAAAWHNSRVNRMDLAEEKTYWVIGTGERFYGPGADANANGTILDEVKMDLPSAIVFDAEGRMIFADQANHIIRRVDLAAGTIENIAGQPRVAGHDGDGGPAADAHLHSHTDQKADPGSKLALDGNLLYYADTVNGVIRAIDLDTMTIDHVAGKFESLGMTTIVDAITGLSYEADAGSVPGASGNGGSAVDAVLNQPRDIAVGVDGEIYLAEPKNQCVRVIHADGTIDAFAGQCTVGAVGAFVGDEGPATDASLNEPFGVSVDAEGNVYIADTLNQVIRRVKR